MVSPAELVLSVLWARRAVSDSMALATAAMPSFALEASGHLRALTLLFLPGLFCARFLPFLGICGALPLL